MNLSHARHLLPSLKFLGSNGQCPKEGIKPWILSIWLATASARGHSTRGPLTLAVQKPPPETSIGREFVRYQLFSETFELTSSFMVRYRFGLVFLCLRNSLAKGWSVSLVWLSFLIVVIRHLLIFNSLLILYDFLFGRIFFPCSLRR